MAEERLEPEVIQIFEHIAAGRNFLLSGGAGSGKTYSLVQVIKKAITDNPTAKVACMTYTNAAVKEIEERVGHKNLTVSTIHDFLWDNIKTYKKELKRGLISLLNDTASKIKKPSDVEGDVPDTYFDSLKDGIQYREHLKIKDGIVSHDEVLVLANYMFRIHRLLCDILKDKFKFIFIDEYQDTSPLVVQIFLEYLANSPKRNIIGFFGDAMQSIYEDRIGDLRAYIEEGKVFEVQKKQNRRNPKGVMDLANNLRTDGLTQEPSTDEKAPNMVDGTVKNGCIKFLYSSGKNPDEIKESDYFRDWDFENPKQTKELNLTYNLIASRAGFPTLMEIYDKDPIIAFKNDLVKKIKADGTILNDEATFDEVADLIAPRNRQRELKKDILIGDSTNNALYQLLKDKPFSEVRSIYLNKDSLIDDKKNNEEEEKKKGAKRDRLIKHLFKIQTNIHLYKEGRYNEFLRKTEFEIKSVADKRRIKEVIDDISMLSDSTIEEVINIADEKGLCKKDDSLTHFIENNEYLFTRVKNVKFQEFQKLFEYLEGYTPFSTQHKTKGTEFNNVLVVLDNGNWNEYNFEYLFNEGIFDSLDRKKKESFPRILYRTQKIFYVCCTRAKENLTVYFDSPSEEVIAQAKVWFGEENVHEV